MADIGTVLGGRYRLVELLGQGGMATIYRARDNQLERDVAVKVLRPEYGADPDFNERFRHEAQSAASLNHPNVVAVHDFGTDPAGPFIVMELVEGEDLASIIRRSGALPPRAAARLVGQAARALAAAHERGFVHRDVKPGNILVTREGRVKVADFGIVRAVSESGLTLPGTTLGSVHYFSPEQARGESATPASDVYSLGIVLFEMLTGRRPWSGDTAAAIATARLTGAVPSPSAVRAGIPPALEGITHKALATQPGDRFASAGDMAEALERFLAQAEPAPARGAAAAGAAAAAAGSAGATAAAGAGTGAPGAAGAAQAVGATGATAPVGVGVARPNPDARIPYPREAYAGSRGTRPPRPPRGGVVGVDEYSDADESPSRPTGPWLWISALLALGVLALAAFLLFQFLSGSSTPPVTQVAVPNVVGKTFEEARTAVTAAGLAIQQEGFEESTLPVGSVTRQDPPEGATVDRGSTVKVWIAMGPQTTVVPDLRARPELEAVNLIQDAGLRVGVRSEAFDAIIPAGSVISQDPGPGAPVAKNTVVNYIVSKGPEPTPTPSPTPVPTPPPTPRPPTPQPTPAPLPVGDYRCKELAPAQLQILLDGFTLGPVSPDGANEAWVVISQSPTQGSLAAPGSPISLVVQELAPSPCPP